MKFNSRKILNGVELPKSDPQTTGYRAASVLTLPEKVEPKRCLSGGVLENGPFGVLHNHV